MSDINKDELFDTVREILTGIFGDRLVSIKVFGSYATGAITDDSDLDLFVILDVPDDATIDAAVKALVALNLPVPVDVIVRTPGQIKERLAIGDPFFKDVHANGIEIHETVDA